MKSKQAVFDELIEESLPMLRSAAYGVLGNVTDAEDAVQEALLRAWKKYGFFRFRSQLTSWVYRITLNVSYDMLRKRKSEQAKLEAYSAADNAPESDDTLERLENAIAELPEIYREAVAIGCLSSLSGEEAAQHLNCPVNTLYWRIHQAKNLLREKLKGL